MAKKMHPHKNLGSWLHPKKPNELAVPMKPHVAPMRQTKLDTPKAPVKLAAKPKMMSGRHGSR